MILLVLAMALTGGILWAHAKSQDEKCTDVEIVVVNGDSTAFVTPAGVMSDLKGHGVELVGKAMADINASDVEEALRDSPYLESADIVKCQGGRLLIRVSQLVPVMRVFDGDHSYYVNRAGKRMDASIYYHSDVPVVQGHFTRQFPPTKLLPMIDYVESDSLLRSLVSMYCVRDTNNIIIVPELSGHVVNMGNTRGFENKFAKLKLFYREVMPTRGWNTFDTISVKWNHQVVATRRVKAVVQTIEYDPEDDEQAPSIETTDVQPLSPTKQDEKKQPEATPAADGDNKSTQTSTSNTKKKIN